MNAELELKGELINRAKIKCAYIYKEFSYNSKQLFLLKLQYSDHELEEFYKELDFEYDSGYGGQELFGTVWLEDGTWLSRVEYDGSEWWEHNSLPEIPLNLRMLRDGEVTNTKLFSKEKSIEIFLKNSRKIIGIDKESKIQYFEPENLEDVANEIFSLENVFVAQNPLEFYFNKDGKFVSEFPVNSNRSLDLHEIIKDIKKQLELERIVYVYQYYGIKSGLVTGWGENQKIKKDVNTYWWRTRAIKEE